MYLESFKPVSCFNNFAKTKLANFIVIFFSCGLITLSAQANHSRQKGPVPAAPMAPSNFSQTLRDLGQNKISLNAVLALAQSEKDPILARARAYYEVGQYSQAEDEYRKISPGSRSYWPSRQELAWTLFQQHKLSSARGLISELQKVKIPPSEGLEIKVIAGYIDLLSCDYHSAQNKSQEFFAEIAPIAQRLDKLPKNKFIAYRNAVAEAILKMKFIKLQVESHIVRQQSGLFGKTEGPTINPAELPETKSEFAKSKMNFPVLEEYWSDEIDNSKSFAVSHCAQWDAEQNREIN